MATVSKLQYYAGHWDDGPILVLKGEETCRIFVVISNKLY